jgi:oxygen-independent coproporphyrinogen III oxidase
MNLQALSLGLYVHVPFCANRCDYCHFFKMLPNREALEQYLTKVKEESIFWQTEIGERHYETIFWGGGSPSCLREEHLETLAAFCRKDENLKEWTVEVSPNSITRNKLQLLKDLGVTRISMGVQSFNADTLKYLGRHQSVRQAYQAYDWIREVGFENVNLDLIFSPGFSVIKQWKQDLMTAIRLNPEHLSTYCLTYENTTGPFTPEKHADVDEDKEAYFYTFTWNFLEKQGYKHYEVSNFSKPGFQCLHNMNTWRMQEWIGLGPSAASQYTMHRFQNPSNMPRWLKGEHVSKETLTEEILCKDCLIFGLRTCEGVNLSQLQQRFPNCTLSLYTDLWKHLKQEGLIIFNQNHIRCTQKGLLLADSIALEILSEI